MTHEPEERRRRITERTRQLILMRETGPKRAAWHVARMRMIWRLHDELRRLDGLGRPTESTEGTDNG